MPRRVKATAMLLPSPPRPTTATRALCRASSCSCVSPLPSAALISSYEADDFQFIGVGNCCTAKVRLLDDIAVKLDGNKCSAIAELREQLAEHGGAG